jgi:hypothetical protein
VNRSVGSRPVPETPVPEGESAPGSTAPRRRSWRRFGLLVVVLSFVATWGYVMYLSIFVGRADPRDHLEDSRWVETAEATCAPTSAYVASLPFASEVDDPAERADLLDTATDELDRMVDRLRALDEPSRPEEARAVDRWLDDWAVYVEDRREYADAFRAGEDRPFTVTDRDGYQVDVLLEDFAAEANDMPSCAPPDDVG